jgi:hypothetical protein
MDYILEQRYSTLHLSRFLLACIIPLQMLAYVYLKGLFKGRRSEHFIDQATIKVDFFENFTFFHSKLRLLQQGQYHYFDFH